MLNNVIKYLTSVCLVVILTMIAPLSVFADEVLFYLPERSGKSPNRYDRLLSSEIPFNKSYAQLSESQKIAARAYYSKLSDQDSPPYPISGMKNLYWALIQFQIKRKKLPPEGGLMNARRDKYQYRRGNFKARVLVGVDGMVESVEVLESPSKRIERFMVKKIRNTKFSPGIVAGVRVKAEFRFQLHSAGSATYAYKFFIPSEWQN